MGALTGAIIGAAGTAYAANRSANAAGDASRALGDAAAQGRADHQRFYDLFAGNASPYLQTGQQGLSALNRLMGGDYSQALAGPDYQARFSQGLKALDRSAAARGSLHSGGHSADLMDYGGQMASQGIGDYRNALFGMSQLGAGMTSNLGSAGLSTANGAAQQANLAGSARASGYISQGNTWGQLGTGLTGLFGQWYRQNSANNGGGSPWYFGNQPGPG